MSKARSNSQDDFTPSGNIAATTRLLALQELDTEKFGKNTILGTVSQTAGLPTGAIIERSSNANGEYVKFADGTMICIKTQVDAASQLNIAVGSIFRTLSTSWTYPAAFLVIPTAAAVGQTTVVRFWTGFGDSGNSAISMTWMAFAAEANATPVVSLFAIGRWF